MTVRQIAIVAAGAMGSGLAQRLTSSGRCKVLTDLDGRSEETKRRAKEAGMDDVSLSEIAGRAEWVLSVLPPVEAVAFAERFLEAAEAVRYEDRRVVFADCNAVNPETVKKIAGLFARSSAGIKFIDASIIGGPPGDGHDPTIYASVGQGDDEILEAFAGLSALGLRITPLKGEGAGIGDASALKMSYAGITKGTTGLFATMILGVSVKVLARRLHQYSRYLPAAHASSPATAEALLKELQCSQSAFLQRITRVVPGMLPKAWRFAGEMEELAEFVGGEEAEVYKGLAKLYERVARSMAGEDSDHPDGGDVAVLKRFVESAKRDIQSS